MLRTQTWFRCDSSLGRWPRPDHEEPEYPVRRPQGKEVSQWKDWNKAPDLLPCHLPPCSSSGLSCLMRFLKVPPGDWQILKELSGQNQHQDPGPSKSTAASQGCGWDTLQGIPTRGRSALQCTVLITARAPHPDTGEESRESRWAHAIHSPLQAQHPLLPEVTIKHSLYLVTV